MYADGRTIDFYDSDSRNYASWSERERPSKFLERMIRRLPANGTVLDLGCGAGWDSAVFKSRGFNVRAIDASRGLAEEAAQRLSVDVACMTFDRLDWHAEVDGVWASYSLQHVPRSGLPDILKRVRRAMKPCARIYIGVHKGRETRRDALGRLYCHYEEDDISALLSAAGFRDIECEVTRGRGYDGSSGENLNLEARADD